MLKYKCNCQEDAITCTSWRKWDLKSNVTVGPLPISSFNEASYKVEERERMKEDGGGGTSEGEGLK